MSWAYDLAELLPFVQVMLTTTVNFLGGAKLVINIVWHAWIELKNIGLVGADSEWNPSPSHKNDVHKAYEHSANYSRTFPDLK